ncbi:hypothetical protein [Bacillus wiedmannii]|uniref:hypothetical protein n=1 Tax=Bacillus wiedmannii TaxID=1890302 RepID=UPI00211D629B|nr:hypothetical protein [Bacillus wiedmannii]
MFKKIPIRLRLTAVMIILLMICCIGLTLILNFYAGIMATRIDAASLLPALEVGEDSNVIDNHQTPPNVMMAIPTEDAQKARTDFQFESVFYMLLVIFGGGVLTYYASGKVLKPLDVKLRIGLCIIYQKR